MLYNHAFYCDEKTIKIKKNGLKVTWVHSFCLEYICYFLLNVLFWYSVEKVTSSPKYSGGEKLLASSKEGNSTSARISPSNLPWKISSSIIKWSPKGIS